MEYRQRGRLQNFDLILPNIEFRLNIITAEGNRLNFHIIFSDTVDVEDIEDFLNRVKLILSEPGSSSFQGVGCSQRGLIRVGRVYANNENLPEEEALKIGFRQAVVDFAQLLNELENTPGLGGKYLIMIGEDTHGGLSEIPYDQAGHLRTEFYRKCHVIGSSNESTIKFWLGKSEKISIDELIDRFGGCKPCIRGSDAHSFDRLCKPTNNLFTWIKADPTFEGLKQIIYEPEERVRIHEDNPEPRKSIYTLSSIKISNSKISDELEIEEQQIPLNPNLVAVIGGKGSGKTALLDLIANCFEDRCKRNDDKREDKNSFVQRIEDQKPDLTVEISFIGEDVENFSKQLTEEVFFPHSKITYLPQGKIEEYSGDRIKLHEKIKEIIFSNKDVEESGYKEEFEKLSEGIKTIEKEIRDVNSEIHNLEEETRSEIISELEGKKSLKEGELKDKEAKLQELLKKIGDSKEKVEELKKEEDSLRSKHSQLEIMKNTLTSLQNKINELLEINSRINEINSDLTKLDIPVNILP
ncbi:hypothetical protein GAH_00009 [Geoglobus ahangari]|uniref:Rad50/SbcC-type AAA domain-containing protein n=1 Tax=Geoglobus ahangari TaxID=113653 RepID=A0A0F7IK35_9EURY|nr:AAA family ATPase [Geoglobus ahangari]AKG92625.1 hypothetical protein GAH_00009 [Geoglobus ahangari]